MKRLLSNFHKIITSLTHDTSDTFTRFSTPLCSQKRRAPIEPRHELDLKCTCNITDKGIARIYAGKHSKISILTS